jgi:hypothetical protein
MTPTTAGWSSPVRRRKKPSGEQCAPSFQAWSSEPPDSPRARYGARRVIGEDWRSTRLITVGEHEVNRTTAISQSDEERNPREYLRHRLSLLLARSTSSLPWLRA